MPPLISHHRTRNIAPFCWPILLLLLLQKDLKHTVLSFKVLRAFSLRLVYEHGQKDPPAFFRRPHFKISIRLLFRRANIGAKTKLSHSLTQEADMTFIPFSSARVTCQEKFFMRHHYSSRTPHEITHICFLSSILSSSSLLPPFRAL